MINQIHIKNYKSALDLSIPLTRLTVLIGENGAGKSNILESLVLAAAASSNKLDTEYLTARGVRLTEPRLMKSAFNATTKTKPIKIDVVAQNLTTASAAPQTLSYVINYDDSSNVRQWTLDSRSAFATSDPSRIAGNLIKIAKKNGTSNKETASELRKVAELIQSAAKSLTEDTSSPNRKTSLTLEVSDAVAYALGFYLGKFSFDRFTVYNPNYESLKNHSATPPTSPIGPRGEGLLSELINIQQRNNSRFQDIVESLELFGWFNGIKIPNSNNSISDQETNRIEIRDKFIRSRNLDISETSANEGFLFALMYLTLICSESTPHVFAIENIETALNPRLCEVLVKRLANLSKKYNKQVIITTHSPSVLDGINLDDPEQSLAIVSRNPIGHTIARIFKKPKATDGKISYRLSEAFLKGHIGGLPKGF